MKELPFEITESGFRLALQRERQLLRREAGLPPKEPRDDKSALSQQPRRPHEPQRKAPASGRQPLGCGRFD